MESPRTITILWATAVLLALAAAALGRQEVTGIGTPAPVVTPPVAPQRLVTDDYFGTQVTDPYRYMEDATDPQVLAWIKAQDDFTRALLTRIPGRLRLIERIQHLDADPPANVTAVRRLPHERYFYEKALASDSVPKLYVRDTLAGAERMLVDPARYVKAGTQQASIGYYQPSFDGAYVITGVSAGGSENAILRVASTQDGRDTGDIIDRAQAAHPSWLPDNRSFLYNRLRKLEAGASAVDRYAGSKVFRHALGSDPESDRAIFGADVSSRIQFAPIDAPDVVTFPQSRYAFGVVHHGVDFALTLYVALLTDLNQANIPWVKVCEGLNQVTAFAPHGDEIYLLTYKNAPRFKVIRTNLVHPNVANGQVIVPSGNGVIKQIAAAEDALYVKVLTGGVSALQRVPFSGRGAGHPRTIPLPLSGTLSVDSADARISGMLFQFTSWTQEPAIYTYDPRSGSSTNTGLQAHGPLDSPPDLVTEEVMAKSYDGTLIPLSILHRRAIKLDGSYPALLYGYGAYGIALEHAYSPDKIAWVEEGGVYAEAQVRGGGAYGEQWHRAGMQLTKHNTWQDFIACAQYLIDNGYTSSARLAGGGGSAGGITIGRAITERPDLFAVAFHISGIADALRMEREPEGPANIPEFGSTSSPEGFKGLYAMSPYANVHEKTAYPAVMVLTGMNDPRVPFWQAAKLAARLQAATTSGKPVLLRADYSGGHGTNGSNRRQVAEFWGDMESFALWQLGVPGFQPAR